jgi:hypothetical protein
VKIFVVSGSTGEYSDRTDWMVRAYDDEEAAKACVIEFDRVAKEIEARTQLDPGDPQHIERWAYSGYEDEEPAIKHPDPSFSMSYTGTIYGYAEIDLVTGAKP